MTRYIIKKYSKTNLKVIKFHNRFVIYYQTSNKRFLKFFGTYSEEEMIKAWELARSLFIIFNHASYWKSEKELMNDDNSLFKQYIESRSKQ